ncbi:urea ABC transporter permease subunit UrtB [Methylotuvimicrobium buryatense]|uniref:Urea ABC transporter permease subunit UrtB n=2 Tax=Methylotuvimicrobium buryatense TaxID=95641 RepID=A0A4P9UVQ2_METBY|nr:urea ABC transporter permease subunit UrtB [Methylotuvimicrobium buryatense]
MLCVRPGIALDESTAETAESQEVSEQQAETVLDPFADALARLISGSMKEREQASEQLSVTGHPEALPVLEALLDGRLYALRDKQTAVIATESGQGYRIAEASTGADLGLIERSDLSKVNITNSLRTKLRKKISLLQLQSDDASVRLSAVNAMVKTADAKTLELLKEYESTESDEDVLSSMRLIFALNDLQNNDKSVRLDAMDTLKEYNSLEAYNRLSVLVEKDSAGNFIEQDVEVRKKAQSALKKIEARLQFYNSVETMFFGLSLGAVLVLAAIGLAITFGVMGVINMAHGELMMLGAYTTYVMQQIMPNHIGLSVILAIPAAFMISALVGVAIERGIIRFLYGRPLETLLATFGISLFLQQTVRSIFSPLNRSVTTPEWMSGSWQINDFLSLTWNRFYIVLFCLLVFAALLQILKKTRLGLEVRAVAQNRNMAKAMGIPTARVDAMTFGLGSGIAGVAGVALSQITNVGPNLGQSYIVDSFMVVVFGGVGNLWGTLVAGFSLGIANKMLEPHAGAVLAKILVLVFIILFIQKRPRGLFPQKGRAAEA